MRLGDRGFEGSKGRTRGTGAIVLRIYGDKEVAIPFMTGSAASLSINHDRRRKKEDVRKTINDGKPVVI